MKHLLARAADAFGKAYSNVARFSRQRFVRILGMLLGGVLLGIGLWNSLQNSNLAAMISALGTFGLVAALLLQTFVQFIGATAWASVVDALAPGIGFGRAIKSFFLTIPMKYLPGSVWSHAGKAVWVSETMPRRQLDQSSDRLGRGLVAATIDFCLLLWSGLVATLLSGLVQFPGLARQFLSPGIWNSFAIVAVVATIFLPYILWARLGRRLDGSRSRFVIRIWASGALQGMGWILSGLLLGHLATGLSGTAQPQPSLSDSMLAHFLGIAAGIAAPFVPNGLGVRETITSIAYRDVVAAGAGFSAAFVLRLGVLVTELLIFLAVSIKWGEIAHKLARLLHTGD